MLNPVGPPCTQLVSSLDVDKFRVKLMKQSGLDHLLKVVIEALDQFGVSLECPGIGFLDLFLEIQYFDISTIPLIYVKY